MWTACFRVVSRWEFIVEMTTTSTADPTHFP
jgi:hypothetical protein